MADVIIRARGLKRIYYLEGEEVHALDGVDLDVHRNEYLSIMGPSGSGKSTLFNMIGGLDRPTSGEIILEKEDISQLSERKLAWLRGHKIGYIFQSFNLISTLSAAGNVSLPLIFAGMPQAEAERRAAKVLERVGLGERTDHRPEELSGGQRQRVAIARALVNEPAIILADEPTGNLDLQTGKEILGLLKELQNEMGATVIAATHDHKMLAASDRVVWIADGKVERIALRDELKIDVGSSADESLV